MRSTSCWYGDSRSGTAATHLKAWKRCCARGDPPIGRLTNDGLESRDARQFGQALSPGQGDELSDIGGAGAGAAGRGIQLAAQSVLSDGAGHYVATLDVVADRPGRQRRDAAAA